MKFNILLTISFQFKKNLYITSTNLQICLLLIYTEYLIQYLWLR